MEHVPTPSTEPHDRVAALLHGFGPIGILAILIILAAGPWIGAPLALAWAWRSRTPWRELGFVRPRSWFLTIALGIVAGIALKLLMKAIVMPLLDAPDTNAAFQHLVGNTAALPGTFFSVIIGAGIGEEIVWRGFLFERLRCLIGTGTKAKIATVLIAATLFGLAHYMSQHWMGVEQAFLVGTLSGAFFVATRQLWPLIVMHATFDVVGVLIIYWDLETTLAHVVFH